MTRDYRKLCADPYSSLNFPKCVHKAVRWKRRRKRQRREMSVSCGGIRSLAILPLRKRSRRFLFRRRKKSTRALIMYSISLYVAEKHYEFFLLHTSYYSSLLLLFQRFFLTVALFSSKKFTQIVFVALDWITLRAEIPIGDAHRLIRHTH